jgi:tetratricopeptide (TPR) repeat protein
MLNDNEIKRLETLDRYLLGELSKEEQKQLEQLIQTDPELAEELEILKLSQDAVRAQGMRKRVADWHQQHAFSNEITNYQLEKEDSKIRTIWRNMGRIAAVLLFGVAGYVLIEYATMTPEALYDENFISYQLPITRAQSEESSLIDSLYVAEQYPEVVERYQTLSSPKVQDMFLTSVSLLQLEKYNEATQMLSKVLETNQTMKDSLFQEEAEFYLALAWLGVHNYEEAEQLFRKIQNNPQHTFHRNITSSDTRKLRILRLLK